MFAIEVRQITFPKSRQLKRNISVTLLKHISTIYTISLLEMINFASSQK